MGGLAMQAFACKRTIGSVLHSISASPHARVLGMRPALGSFAAATYPNVGLQTRSVSGKRRHTGRAVYHKNRTLRIRAHLPPEPFEGDYEKNPRPPIDWSRWRSEDNPDVDRIELALAHPPLETDPPAPGPAKHTLTITGTKTRRVDRRGAQVVTCFLGQDPSVEYVAKIYDGVYYPLDFDGDEVINFDGMTWADRNYSIEAWAYRIMQPAIGSTGVVPAYFGSWTFPLNASHRRQRWVRMILVDLIQGECMADIIDRAVDKDENVNYALLPPEDFRLRVLQSILEADEAIWWEAAINHLDLVPRNVVVKPDGSVTIIDFSQVYINKFSCYDCDHPRKDDPTQLPISPIERYWPFPSGFADSAIQGGPWEAWIPARWLEDHGLAVEYLVATFRDSPKYAPPSPEFLDTEWDPSVGQKSLGLLDSLGRKLVKQA